jgi:RNA polymerase sigma-70 factor, ECF subfamily
VDLAETLTQECFLKAHRNWSELSRRLERDDLADADRHQPAEGLTGATGGLQFWRQTRTNAVDLDEASDWLPNGERNAEQQMLAREQVAQVWQAVEGLSERQRTVFLLRYVEERELSEIAEHRTERRHGESAPFAGAGNECARS